MEKNNVIKTFKEEKERQSRLNAVLDEVYSIEEARELKQIIAAYFARKLSEEMQRIADGKGYTRDSYKELGKEHLRTPYDPA